MLECTTCKFAKNAFRVYHRLRRDNFEPLWRKASLLQIAKDRFVTWRWPGLKNGTFHIDPLNHKSRAGVLVGADFFNRRRQRRQAFGKDADAVLASLLTSAGNRFYCDRHPATTNSARQRTTQSFR